MRSWEALSKTTGREHAHLALPKEDEKIRFRDVVAQPRKIISAPTWSGLESEKVCYNAGYTNVHELIPWRTLTGRQQLYQDHKWMLAFGEGLCVYRPPVDLRTTRPVIDRKPNGNKQVVLNFITPHQKWGIHSTYTDNLMMLTLSRGGPIVWLSEVDAAKAGIVDSISACMCPSGVIVCLTAPMPGKLVQVLVKPGDAVEKGQPLVVLEAMKMEQPLTAHKAGKISNLVAEIGETVASGTKLCLIVD